MAYLTQKILSDKHHGSTFNAISILLLPFILFFLITPISFAQTDDCNGNGISDSKDADADKDGIPNACDVCPYIENKGQIDSNNDGFGNACDPDIDNNGIVDNPDLDALNKALASREGSENFNPDADFDDNGVIDSMDLEILKRFFKKPPGPGKMPVTLVRGYIATTANTAEDQGERKASTSIYLPGIEVFIRNLLTGNDSDSVLTDLSGRFTLAPFEKGRIRICWRAKGFLEGCTDKIYSISTTPLHTSKINIFPADKGPEIYGKVTLADGASVRALAPIANINAFATVELLDKAGSVIHTTFVNNFQQYLLPSVPTHEAITIRVTADNEVMENVIFPEANLQGAAAHKIDITFANSAPRIKPLTATDGNRRIQVATPGSILLLSASAKDPDGDDIKYKWQINAGSGSLSAYDSPSVKWKLPSAAGQYSVEVFAYDGRGGYSSSRLSIKADNAGVPFSGTVRGTDITAIQNAEVEVNGEKTLSDSRGFFSLRVAEKSRYVLNIRKPGYGLMSKIYNDSITGGEWALVKASVYAVDPTKDIIVADERSQRNCIGPKSFGLNWKSFPGLAEPQWQDGKSNVISPRNKELTVPVPGIDDLRRDCGPGIRLTIPANSLVDSNGKPPPGLVDVALSTIDLLSPQQMPGDYTVELPAGDTGVAQSYGAGTVDITDGSTEYNLKPGASAKLEISADSSQLSTGAPLPPIIPILFYDEEKGVWYEEGSATLTGTTYVSKIPHFSTINVDLVKQDQSCVRVLSPLLPAFYDLEVIIPMGSGAAPKILNIQIDNASPSEHVIYNLPNNANIVLTPIRQSDNVPFGNFVVNTGAAQNPTSPNLPVGPPYDACATEVTLSDLVIPAEPYSGEFLHGLYTFAASNLTELSAGSPADQQLALDLNTATNNYYFQIDPRAKRLTLGDFKAENGFGGAGEINAKFANSGDLGFGRDMHCLRTGNDVACYVTNYGDYTTPDINDAAATVTQINPIATVAMEYSRIESLPGEPVEFDDPERVVKFYVYAGGDDTGTLLTNADLDEFGARPIPQLCMVCHGGDYPAAPVAGVPTFSDREHVKLGSKFLPFDISLYEFTAPPYDKASQQDEFKDLNENIVYGTPSDTVIEELINDMYAGGAIQDEDFSVAGWTNSALEETMYETTIARSCRTCHVGHAFPSLQFGSSSDVITILGQVETRVCTEHVMPHARATHNLFWGSSGPAQPGILQVFGDNFGSGTNGWDGTLCGDFTPGGNTPIGFYDANIQPLWNGVGTGATACTACHTGGSPPASLSLTAGSHADIFNQNSTTNIGDLLVAPGGGASAVNNSLIFQVLRDTTAPAPPGRMPPPGSEINNSALNTVESWILSGAPQ